MGPNSLDKAKALLVSVARANVNSMGIDLLMHIFAYTNPRDKGHSLIVFRVRMCPSLAMEKKFQQSLLASPLYCHIFFCTCA